uniref:EMI domain-containing protein n=1 Tax=Cyprinodon variegatus TaxID=28743 RepID=A0A3Q2FDY0_CYPVA
AGCRSCGFLVRAGRLLPAEGCAFPGSNPSDYYSWNWCPHTVTKTVTCQVQNGTILQRVYQTCRWPQGCSGGSYKTVVRPSYKVVYRTVTSLEWKCCPGFSGTACAEGKRYLKEDFQEYGNCDLFFTVPFPFSSCLLICPSFPIFSLKSYTRNPICALQCACASNTLEQE